MESILLMPIELTLHNFDGASVVWTSAFLLSVPTYLFQVGLILCDMDLALRADFDMSERCGP